MRVGRHPHAGPGTARIRVSRWLALASIASIAAAGCWAAWPIPAASVRIPSIGADEPLVAARVAILDADAFKAPIWVAPRPPIAPTASAPPPPPAPLRVQLLAILRESAELRAALYDLDSDRLLVVGEGERIGSRVVDTVGEDRVSLRDDRGVKILTLRTDGGVP